MTRRNSDFKAPARICAWLLSLALLPALALSAARAAGKQVAADSRPSAITQTIEDNGAKYAVTVEPEGQKVEVVREGPTLSSPPQLRLRIHRKQQPPLDIRLSTLEPQRPTQPMHYAGRIDKWNQSYVGFELQFSFDKKTWSRLGNVFK